MFACAQWGAVGEFAASRHGAVTRKQAAELGISNKVVARLKSSGHLLEPLPGVLIVVGSVPTWEQRLTVATLASSQAGIASHRSAAALHGFDGYARRPIEVIVPNWRPVIASFAQQHQSLVPGCDAVRIDNIRCTGVARTLADLGAVDPIGRVRTAFESAWRRGASLLWLRETAERLHRPGQSGTRVLLTLLDEAERHRRPTESTLELRLEACLRGIEGLVRQHTVTAESGQFVARVDFAVPRVKLAIEAHSRQFHFGSEAIHHDEAREHSLGAQGWMVVYMGDRHIRSKARVRKQVLDIIRARET